MTKFATAFVLNSQKQLLLVKRREGTEVLPGKWGYPGGMIEGGDSVETTIHKEIIAETGFDVDIIRVGKDITVSVGKSKIVAVPVLCTTDKEDVKLDYEHTEYRWIDPLDLLKYDLGVPKKDVINLTSSIGIKIR